MGALVIQYSARYYPNGRVDPGVASNPNVTGVLLTYNWRDVEPSDGNYNWSKIDNEISLAVGAGKKIALGITAGSWSPSWLYTEGAQPFSFVWSFGWGYTPCSIQQIPLPWDPVFQAKWATFVAALGARYDSNPNVVAVKISGVNSLEITLPQSVNQPINLNGSSCTTYNDIANWQAAGYTRTLEEGAWNAITADFINAFPNTAVEAMMNPASFVPIDQNGNVLSPPANGDKQGNIDVINGAIANYGQQFVLANDGLSPNWIWQLELGYNNQINTGYQMVSSPMGSQLAGAVSLGLSGNPVYFEISDPDVDNSSLSGTIATAAASLP
jgi:hypothetical protein